MALSSFDLSVDGRMGFFLYGLFFFSCDRILYARIVRQSKPHNLRRFTLTATLKSTAGRCTSSAARRVFQCGAAVLGLAKRAECPAVKGA